MGEDRLEKLKIEIENLHHSVSELKKIFPIKKSGFTLDGRLVGDMGEVVAAELFQIELHEKLKLHYDAVTTYEPKLNVQIKATFKESLTFNHAPDYYLGIKFYANGDYKVVYNGPGKYIKEAYMHRKHISEKLLSFPINKLIELSSKIKDSERILLKEKVKDNTEVK